MHRNQSNSFKFLKEFSNGNKIEFFITMGHKTAIVIYLITILIGLFIIEAIDIVSLKELLKGLLL
jgi:hypothetical protein